MSGEEILYLKGAFNNKGVNGGPTVQGWTVKPG